MADIFISYASGDRLKVKKIASVLEQLGWSIWWDNVIPVGESFHKVIEEAIADSQCVLVLWSVNSIKSSWVLNEAEEGRRRGILIPVLLDKVNIPLGFRHIQAAHLYKWQGDKKDPEFQKLISSIEDLNFTELSPQSVTPNPNEARAPQIEPYELIRQKFKLARLISKIVLGCFVSLFIVVFVWSKIQPEPPIDKVKLRHVEVQPNMVKVGDSVKLIMDYVVQANDSEKSVEVGEGWVLMKGGQKLAELPIQKQLRKAGYRLADATMPIPTNAESGIYVVINKVSTATSEDSLTSTFFIE